MVVCWVFYGGRIGHVILVVMFVVLVCRKGEGVITAGYAYAGCGNAERWLGWTARWLGRDALRQARVVYAGLAGVLWGCLTRRDTRLVDDMTGVHFRVDIS